MGGLGGQIVSTVARSVPSLERPAEAGRAPSTDPLAVGGKPAFCALGDARGRRGEALAKRTDGRHTSTGAVAGLKKIVCCDLVLLVGVSR